VILQPLASAIAVLNDDEKELGVCLMDIGGGTTDVRCRRRRDPAHGGDPIPATGDQRHRDDAAHADQGSGGAQVRHGCALRQLADAKDVVRVPGWASAPRQAVAADAGEVIEPRIEELYTLVQSELRRSGFEELCRRGSC